MLSLLFPFVLFYVYTSAWLGNMLPAWLGICYLLIQVFFVALTWNYVTWFNAVWQCVARECMFSNSTRTFLYSFLFLHSSIKYSILIFFLFEHQLVCFLCFDILVDVVFIYNTTNARTNVTTSSIAAAAHSSNTQHPAISNFQFIEKCLSSHHTITLPVHTSTHLRRKVFIYVTIERVQNNQQVCHC